MIYAYYQGDNIGYWLSRSGLEFHHDTSYDEWLERPQHQRLALHEEVVHSESSARQIHRLVKNSALCMIFVPELIDDAWFRQFDRENVVFFMAGYLNRPESDQSLLTRDQWYRAVLTELGKMPDFHPSYASVADPSWPSADQLLAMPVPPHYIIDELCGHFHGYPQIEHVEPVETTYAVVDRWTQILAHPLFAEFYLDVRDPSWPTLEELQTMKAPPELVRQEILMSFQAPEEQDTKQRLDLVHDVLRAATNSGVLELARSEFHYYFFWSTVDLYQRRPYILKLLDPDPDRRGFDALLGRRKSHRDLVYDRIDHDRNVVTYFAQGDPGDVAQSQQFIWPELILPRSTGPVSDTTDEIMVDGVVASLSQVMPIEIYNRTAYSLVCESQCDNGFSFFTEKIIKPMIARRIFVVFSGQHYLRNLRELGFRTFDGIIDEGYDDILRMEDRGQAVLDLVQDLQDRDPQELYQQAREILDHNYQLVMGTDWQQVMCDVIKKHADNVFGNK